MNRADFFQLIANKSSDELVLIQRAYWISKVANRPFVRDSGERSFEHSRAVAVSLIAHGHTEIGFIIRALLHDIVEDANTPSDLIISCFGDEVWRDLLILSKDVRRSDPITGWITKEYKKSPKEYFEEISQASAMVRLVKLADRLHNLKDCTIWDLKRLRRYIAETEEYILPLARTVDSFYECEIASALATITVSI